MALWPSPGATTLRDVGRVPSVHTEAAPKRGGGVRGVTYPGVWDCHGGPAYELKNQGKKVIL